MIPRKEMDGGAFNLTGIDVAEAEKVTNDPSQDPPHSPASSIDNSTVKSEEALLAEKNHDRIINEIEHLTGKLICPSLVAE